MNDPSDNLKEKNCKQKLRKLMQKKTKFSKKQKTLKKLLFGL